jgi:hypothetical protein
MTTSSPGMIWNASAAVVETNWEYCISTTGTMCRGPGHKYYRICSHATEPLVED